VYNHTPPDYECPLCGLVRGRPEPTWNELDDIVMRNADVLAFVAPVWWPNNAGHVIVIPTVHYENIFDLPDELACTIHAAARRIALALKATYGCDGISTRQHNEPGGSQDVWHYHVHVFPRYMGDSLYLSNAQGRRTTAEERRPYAQKLRDYLKAD
jgi:histidine triad (HIT) family protein